MDTRSSQENLNYFSEKKKKKKEVTGEKYFHEFCDRHFEKVTQPGLKVINGTQSTNHILKVFYHEETRELKLVRNLTNWGDDVISLFGVFELKLLHPSYIYFMRTYKMEKAVDEVCEINRKHFEANIEVIFAAMERISFRKALAYANLEKNEDREH